MKQLNCNEVFVVVVAFLYYIQFKSICNTMSKDERCVCVRHFSTFRWEKNKVKSKYCSLWFNAITYKCTLYNLYNHLHHSIVNNFLWKCYLLTCDVKYVEVVWANSQSLTPFTAITKLIFTVLHFKWAKSTRWLW